VDDEDGGVVVTHWMSDLNADFDILQAQVSWHSPSCLRTVKTDEGGL
jgi:hypothetical protein